MRAEYLKGWLWGANHKKHPVSRIWELVERLIKMAFGDGNLPEELAWETMVLLPKGKGEYWGIRIFEVT